MKTFKFIIILLTLLLSNFLYSQELQQDYSLRHLQTKIDSKYSGKVLIGALASVALAKIVEKLNPKDPNAGVSILLVALGASLSSPAIFGSETAYDRFKSQPFFQASKEYKKLMNQLHYTQAVQIFPTDKKFQHVIAHLPYGKNKEEIEKATLLYKLLTKIRKVAVDTINKHHKNGPAMEDDINSSEMDLKLESIFDQLEISYNPKHARNLLAFSIIGNLEYDIEKFNELHYILGISE